MTENTESSINSIKLAPMPMSTLIANLWPLQTQDFTPDSSFSSCDSDDSDCETIAKKSPNVPKYTTPTHKLQPTNYTSDKKLRSTNKENTFENWLKSSKTNPNKENRIIQSVNKNAKLYQGSSKEMTKRSALTPQQTNVQTQEKIHTAIKKTPEALKQQQKLKSATPKIKSGIRHYTPGSSRKSQKKTLVQNVIQNKKDKVRCELFSSENKDEVQTKPGKRAAHLFATPAPAPAAPHTPAAVSSTSSVNSTPKVTSVPSSAAKSITASTGVSVPASNALSIPVSAVVSIPVLALAPIPAPIPVSAPVSTPISASVSQPVSVPISAPVLETPMNRRLMPVPCVPTPSYPEGVKGYNTKVTFNTIQVKDKKYLLLKKLGVGGSSEVYKVSCSLL